MTKMSVFVWLWSNPRIRSDHARHKKRATEAALIGHPYWFCRAMRRSYWSMSAVLIARQPEDPSGSVIVTATGLRFTAARLTSIASTRRA